MASASLGLKINDNNTENSIITLETGTLRYIDSIIKSFPHEQALKNDEEFLEKTSNLSKQAIQNSKVILTYIKNNNEKLQLKPIYNDNVPIQTKSNALDLIPSEVERARKLMFSSKNQLFLSMFFRNQALVRTTYSTIKMSAKEYKKAKECGLNILLKDGEYHTRCTRVSS